jgi:hypothetical protein
MNHVYICTNASAHFLNVFATLDVAKRSWQETYSTAHNKHVVFEDGLSTKVYLQGNAGTYEETSRVRVGTIEAIIPNAEIEHL